jgi:hypothetical protein
MHFEGYINIPSTVPVGFEQFELETGAHENPSFNGGDGSNSSVGLP